MLSVENRASRETMNSAVLERDLRMTQLNQICFNLPRFTPGKAVVKMVASSFINSLAGTRGQKLRLKKTIGNEW